MHAEHLIVRLAAASILALLLAACAGSPLSPAEMAARRISKTSAAWDDGVEGVIRYNPVRCECPQFEFLADGAWHRVEIINDVREDTAVDNMFREATASGPGWSCRITGETRGVEKQRYRFPVARLKIVAICGDAACPASNEDATSAKESQSMLNQTEKGEMP